MKTKIDRDIAGGIIFTLFALILWFIIPSQIAVSGSSRINARYVPRVMTMALLIFSAAQLGQAIFKALRRHEENKENYLRFDKGNLYVLLMTAVLVLYLFVMRFIGFEIASVVVSAAVLAILGCKNRKYYLVAVLVAVATGLLFRYAFSTPLP
jgi:hypothetical protein